MREFVSESVEHRHAPVVGLPWMELLAVHEMEHPIALDLPIKAKEGVESLMIDRRRISGLNGRQPVFRGGRGKDIEVVGAAQPQNHEALDSGMESEDRPLPSVAVGRCGA